MQHDSAPIAKLLADAGVDATIEEAPFLGSVFRIPVAMAAEALEALRASERGYRFLVDLFGVDTGEAIDVVYHLRSFAADDEVYLKAFTPYGSTLESVSCVFPGAAFPERECAELFGLTLTAHPNPKRLLTTEKVPPLLLKSTPIRTAEEVRNR